VSHDRVKGHLKSSSHQDKNAHLNQTKLNEALVAMNVAKTHPPPPITMLAQQAPAPFKGLKILEGFACTLCTQLGVSEAYIKDHYSREHHTNIASSDLSHCFLQRYSLAHTGPLRALFRVQPPSQDESPTPELSIADRVREQMAAVSLFRPESLKDSQASTAFSTGISTQIHKSTLQLRSQPDPGAGPIISHQ
jgi:hypothetical protein